MRFPLIVSGIFAAVSLVLLPMAMAQEVTDITEATPYADAIHSLIASGAMGGYADGLFRPDRTLSRAEFIKTLVVATGHDDEAKTCLPSKKISFTDAPASAWFTPYACEAKKLGYITGYDDGTFRPAEKLDTAQISVLLVKAFFPSANPVSSDADWYQPAVKLLGSHEVYPPSLESVHTAPTRGEVAEMIFRLQSKDEKQDAASADDLLTNTCSDFAETPVENVDMEEVKRVWISWINDARQDNGLPAYQLDRQLSRTASIWSQHALAAGQISHKRDGQTLYYDYPLITKWFSDEGLTFQNVDRSTFTENIGWGMYACSKDDCTQILIAATRTTFDMYKAEESKASRPHWNSIMNKDFQRVGVGIVVDPDKGEYYITTHYATAITSHPDAVCE